LRIIEEKEFERVGDSKSIKVDVRIISTTNRNLQQEVAKGTFREDLYYRLSIVPLVLPSLRERSSDIPLLVNYFLKKFQENDQPIGIDPPALEQLKTYSWPGNVRELANVVQQMMVFCKGGDLICLHDLPPHLFVRGDDLEERREGNIQLAKMVANLERKWILSKLKEADWNREKAASLLGLTRKMLTDRMRKYQIRVPERRGVAS